MAGLIRRSSAPLVPVTPQAVAAATSGSGGNVGDVIATMAATLPDGWAVMDSPQAVTRAQYPELFTKLGLTGDAFTIPAKAPLIPPTLGGGFTLDGPVYTVGTATVSGDTVTASGMGAAFALSAATLPATGQKKVFWLRVEAATGTPGPSEAVMVAIARDDVDTAAEVPLLTQQPGAGWVLMWYGNGRLDLIGEDGRGNIRSESLALPGTNPGPVVGAEVCIMLDTSAGTRDRWRVLVAGMGNPEGWSGETDNNGNGYEPKLPGQVVADGFGVCTPLRVGIGAQAITAGVGYTVSLQRTGTLVPLSYNPSANGYTALAAPSAPLPGARYAIRLK